MRPFHLAIGFILIGIVAQAQTPPAAPTSVPPAAQTPPTPMFAPPLPPISTAADEAIELPFLESHANLREYIYKQPESGFYFGAGLTPVGILKDKLVFSANFFQVHYLSEMLNWEILNASYSVSIAQQSVYQSNNFVFRTAPKFRFGSILSAGPLFGYEFLSFPHVQARLYKAPYVSPREPFSSRGIIYGLEVSQTFLYKENLIQINEVVFKETYSSVHTEEDWQYLYDDASIQADPKVIGPSLVMMIEIALFF